MHGCGVLCPVCAFLPESPAPCSPGRLDRVLQANSHKSVRVLVNKILISKMTDSVCSLCAAKSASFVCFCTESPVCQSCISRHLLSAPHMPHKPVAITSRELLHFLRSAKQDQPAAQPYLDQLDQEIQQINSAKAQALLDLEKLQEDLESQIRTAISELRTALVTAADKLESVLRNKTTQKSDPAESIQHLKHLCPSVDIRIECKELDITTQVKSSFRASFEVREGRSEVHRSPTVLYKLFGGTNCIGVFDGASEEVGKMMSTNTHFFHNSCYCGAGNGRVYITGGSQTGRSRNEAFSLNSTTFIVTEIQPMQIARRSHAAVGVDNWVYVFGGLLEDDRLSLCERYSIETDQWQGLVPMTERRAYLGCCEHKACIYVAGGSKKTPCEVYNPHTECFRVLPSTLCIEDNCSLISLSTCILLFHGTFNGEVARFDPENGQFSRERDMCAGNSWSNTPPIRVNNYIYMLRADSIFKYRCDSGASCYVARLSKGRPRALN